MLAPRDVAVAAGPISAAQQPLWPEEEAAVARAVPKRKREFRAGRRYARDALAASGCPAGAIPVSPTREPVWSTGFVGSISHSASHAAAVTALSTDYFGVGVDIEPNAPLPTDLVPRICRDAEREALGRPLKIGCNPVDRGKLFFVAKEAAFKAKYPSTKRFIEFTDAVVLFEEGSPNRFTVKPADPGLSPPGPMQGAWAIAEQHIIAWVAIAR